MNIYTCFISNKAMAKKNKANDFTTVIKLVDECTSKLDLFLAEQKGSVEVHNVPVDAFKKNFTGLLWGLKPYEPRVKAQEWLDRAKKLKFSIAAVDHIERILHLDTRGKSTEQIRQEIIRLAADLPKGNVLKNVPASYPDRGQAISAYTSVRQAILSFNKEPATMSKKAGAAAALAEEQPKKSKKEIAAEKKAADKKAAEDKKAADAKVKADVKAAKAGNGDAAALAAAAKGSKEKGGGKTKQDLNGNYIPSGEAAKVKSTEELGMHEDSVRTKVLAVAMASKAKNGVSFEKLAEAGKEQTRGAIQYLMKKGFLARASA